MTVKEIAEKFNVTRAAIYKKINQSMKQELEPFTVKKDGITHLLPQGVKLISKSLHSEREVKNDVEHETKKESVNADVTELLERLNRLESEYINTLKAELDRKNQQLEKKDELLQNFQVIVKHNQERIEQLEGDVEEDKKSFFDKLKWWT